MERYKTLLLAKIKQHWRVQDQQSMLWCQLYIQLDDAGGVNRVQVVQSSGDARFDKAAVSAVKRASPLPLPKNKILSRQARSIKIKFNPTVG